MRAKLILASVLCLVLSGIAMAGVEQYPGYVDFAKFGLGANQEPTVEVNLRGPMLKLAALASDDDDEDLGKMLSGLAGLFVRTYKLDDKSPAAFEKAINDLDTRIHFHSHHIQGQEGAAQYRLVRSLIHCTQDVWPSFFQAH